MTTPASQVSSQTWSEIKAIVAASDQGTPELVELCERFEREAIAAELDAEEQHERELNERQYRHDVWANETFG